MGMEKMPGNDGRDPNEGAFEEGLRQAQNRVAGKPVDAEGNIDAFPQPQFDPEAEFQANLQKLREQGK